MFRAGGIFLLSVLLVLGPAATATAHDGAAHAPAAVDGGADARLTVEVDPEAEGVGTVVVVQGLRVEVTIIGAGAGELHLHGYDVTLRAEAGRPAVITFDAEHAGRFPLAMHVEDALLGSRDKALLYIEVRAP